MNIFRIGFLKNRTFRRAAAGLAAVLVILGGVRVFFGGGRAQENVQDDLMSTTVIEKKDLLKSVSVTGVVATADGRAGNTGLTNLKVERVHVKVGDEVQEGDVLCTFDSTLLEESLAAARNNYEINKKLDAMGADYEKQYRDSMKQADSSLKDSSQKRDQAKNAYQEASGKESTARAAADKAAAALSEKQAACEAAKQAAAAAAQAYEDRQQAAYEAARQAAAADRIQEAEQPPAPEGSQENASAEGQSGAASGSGEEKPVEHSPENTAENPADRLPERTPVVINDIDAYIAGLDVNGPDYTALKDTLNAYSAAKTALEEAKAEAERTRGAYEQAKAETGQAKSSYDQAQTARQEAQNTYDSSIRDAKTAYQKSKLQSQLITDNDAKKQITQYEEQLEDYTVRAPMSGVITSLSVKEGQTFGGGVIYEIQDLKHFVVEASVDEYDVVKIKQGMTAYVKTNSMGEELLKGTVTYVAPTAGAGKGGEAGAGSSQSGSGGSASYQIQITIEGEQEKLRPGMTAKVSIVQEESRGVLAVPYDCVETKEDGTSIIYVDEGGQRKEMTVEKGMETDYFAEIRGKDLKEGMTVYLPDGMRQGGQLPEEESAGNTDEVMYGF